MRISTRQAERIYRKIDDQASMLQFLDDGDLDTRLAKLGSPTGNATQVGPGLVARMALTRELARRTLRDELFAYREQILGAVQLHGGAIIEMANGEGKTLVAALSAAVNACAGRQVHITTYNDYLAKRDATWMGPLYLRMGLKVAVLSDDANTIGTLARASPTVESATGASPSANEFVTWPQRENESIVRASFLPPLARESHVVKEQAYTYTRYPTSSIEGGVILRKADIVYGTAQDFIFQYLRDNRAQDVDSLRLPGSLFWLIMDEADFTLIEEARRDIMLTTGTSERSRWGRDDLMHLFEVVSHFQAGIEFDPSKNYALTFQGEERVANVFGLTSLYRPEAAGLSLLARDAVQAFFNLKRDRDYIVRNNQICSINKDTGRVVPGAKWAIGLEQALQWKEAIWQPETLHEGRPLATISIQHFAKLYERLSGMTATAWHNRREFKEFYELDVVKIPRHHRCLRKDHQDLIVKTRLEKVYLGLLEIEDRSKEGRPVLVDTPDIATAELFHALITAENLEHFFSALTKLVHPSDSQILNPAARSKVLNTMSRTLQDMFTEIHQVLKARRIRPALLTAKNDDQEAPIIARAGEHGAVTISAKMAGRGTDIRLSDEAKAKGGLFVIGFERNKSRHIDEHVKGRTARQGKPGDCMFLLSFDDELMRIFTPEWTVKALDSIGWDEGQPIYHKRISRGILDAQQRIEASGFDTRVQLYRKDAILDWQRRFIYAYRRNILCGYDVLQDMPTIAANISLRAVMQYLESRRRSKWQVTAFQKHLESLSPFQGLNWDVFMDGSRDRLLAKTCEHLLRAMDAATLRCGLDHIKEAARFIMLNLLDRMWERHLSQRETVEKDVFAGNESLEDMLQILELNLNHMYWEQIARVEEAFIEIVFNYQPPSALPASEVAPDETEEEP